MRIPFHSPLRIGTDIIAINRLLSLQRPDIGRLVKLTNHFLHPQELDDLTRRHPLWKDAQAHAPDKPLTRQVASWVAGRWAAKEAAKKAWDASLLSFGDLRVEVDRQGGAVQIVCDTARSTLDGPQVSGQQVTEQVAQLSISHDGDYAVATVLAAPLHPDVSAVLARRKQEAARIVRASLTAN